MLADPPSGRTGAPYRGGLPLPTTLPDVAAIRSTSTSSPRPVPPWALVTAALTPLGMIGGWTLAAARQGPGYDPVRETISALAAGSATTPEVMTAGLALTGLGHLATAAALRPAGTRGRLLLAAGGLATVLVAALPVDASPRAHGLAAAVGFGALALWPAAAVHRGARGILRPAAGFAAAGVLVATLAWFVVELQGLGPDDGALTGLAERAVAGAQSVWPLVVVLALRRGKPAPSACPRADSNCQPTD